MGLLAVALLLNSAVVAYSLYSHREFQEHFRWTMLVTIPGRAAAAAAEPVNTGRVGSSALQVDLYSDFACPYCRASAAAVDSVRRIYGDRVQWRYWHVPRSPAGDPLAMRAAGIGVCTESEGGPWELYRLLSRTEWSESDLMHAVNQLGVEPDSLSRCERSDPTRSRVWSDLFAASRRGITATPTIDVNGTRVEGVLQFEPLVELIEAELARSRSGTADPQARPSVSPRAGM